MSALPAHRSRLRRGDHRTHGHHLASVPDGLPATAAALNESSVAVGSRIGTVVFTALVAQVAL
jgi:hypothetical protein